MAKTKPRLVIGAAHTSSAPGSIHNGLREFDIGRKILEKALPHLKKENIEHKAVPIDLPLLQRIDWVNDTGYTEEKGDIFLEIHVNDGGKRGIESWFRGDDTDSNNSKKFADFFNKEFCALTKYKDQGAKSEYDHQLGSLLILNQTDPIAIAVEFLYIDNEEDSKILKDDKKLDEIAKNLAKTIKKYCDNPPELSKPQPASMPKLPSFGPGSFGGGPSFGGGDFGGGMGGDPLGFDDTGSDSSSSSGATMDREERKKMIEDQYEKLLGKEPKQNDLNYYLNIGVSEDQLIQRIAKSKEHEEMVENAKQFEEMDKKYKAQESKLITLESQVKDMDVMYQNLQRLLQQKNLEISTMQQELRARGIIVPGERYDPNRVQRPVS